MNILSLTKKPIKIRVVQFLGTSSFDWLGVYGNKLPINQRVGKFWNKLHEKELEVNYGDWVAFHDDDDRYPIVDDVINKYYTRD